ncbi:MAG TPA: alcohol dehydrogenase [Bacteroidetes bacterium]|jgi:alcohol dehydrogenase, propanol-preferring|nr:alcohol dehydrogenase [Bacteroidota bacterium]
MKAQRLSAPAPIEEHPLTLTELSKPLPAEHEVLLRVHVCGICHTDLHEVEGDLRLPRLPLTPGHQVVGRIEQTGLSVTKWKKGDRVGVPWLYSTCGRCEFCQSGKENLCDNSRFTGFHANGGFAEYMVANEDFVYALPDSFGDINVAPLLCAGVIGYRALRLSEIKPGGRIGLYGFGASAHIAIQIVRHWGCESYVFTRSKRHRDLAEELGASWTGSAEDTPPQQIDSAVIFAPAGQLVPASLRVLKKGGTVALAGIHMSPIPEMGYSLIYEERSIRSVANSTRDDVRGLLEIAATIPIQTEVETFPLADANSALQKLKKSEIRGSGVLMIIE